MARLNLLHHALFWTLMCLFFLRSASEGINTTAGKNVTLTCRAPNNNNIIVVEWSRADLKDEYVLMYRDSHLYADGQHPSFMNRVDLQDRQMKDGDVSLILKNVTTADNGTYECRIFTRGANWRKGAHLKTPPISIIYLSVVDPPGPTGQVPTVEVIRRRHGLFAGPIFLLSLLAFLIFRRHKKHNQESYQPPAEKQPFWNV
ncbi:programmed cell death 1 ligand 1-like [Oreochromis aureus]|uniref:programmed cell death 1 ligand 1-like n=1 Tax=Oreochromis aureus TaxID=47969 RepID=UPI0019530A36|nr:programmed cell death 1 ligand 1-like [Oreochromis aureus]